MYLKYLNDPNFFELLYKIDKDLAQKYRQSPCPKCGATLHFANYHRKARYIDDKFSLRFSLCCSKCRNRVKVPSTIFFNSFIYGAVFFLIISCFNNNKGHRYKKLSSIFKVSYRTLRRWQRWWDESFIKTNFWKEFKGRFIKISNITPNNLVKEFQTFDAALKFFSQFNCSPIVPRNRC